MRTHTRKSRVAASILLADHLTPAQLATELRVCTKTLERWRAEGAGPPVTKMSRRVLYRRTAVAAWLQSREQQSVIYHGTSTARLEEIRADGALRKDAELNYEPSKVSFTSEHKVAAYWARGAAFRDKRDRRGKPSAPVILHIDGNKVRARYGLTEFSDPVWGEGKCDWERELACFSDVALDVLLAVEPIEGEWEE